MGAVFRIQNKYKKQTLPGLFLEIPLNLLEELLVGPRLVDTIIRQPEIYVYQLDTLLYEGYSCTRLQASGFSHQTA